MTQFLIEHFVKDYEDVEKISVRTAYGVLASIVGIFCNVFLFAVKFTIGVIAHSVSVMADAFNNLSDAGSSIISLDVYKRQERGRVPLIFHMCAFLLRRMPLQSERMSCV